MATTVWCKCLIAVSTVGVFSVVVVSPRVRWRSPTAIRLGLSSA